MVIVHIYSGAKEMQLFKIAKAFLCQSSFFKTILKGVPKDPLDGCWHIKLQDISTSAFALLAHYFQTGKIYETFPADGDTISQAIGNIVDLWLMAAAYVIPGVQNEAMRVLESFRQQYTQLCFP